MKRTKTNKADLIITGDWHLREDSPECRKDSLWDAQWLKVRKIKELQRINDCPVIHSGDLFHKWKPSPYLLSKTIKEIPDKFYTIYGNHDLPQHNLDLVNKTGIHTMETAGKLKILPGTHWEAIPNGNSLIVKDRKILVWHVMAYQGKKSWPGMEALQGITLLRKHPQYDLIITGHNHLTFTEKYKDRCIVNPGSITRQTSAQMEHIPKVFLYFAKTNTVTKYILPHDVGAIRTPPNAEQTKQRDARIDAFIDKLSNDWEGGLDFKKNLEAFLSKNKINQQTKQIIQKAIE